MAVSSLLLLFLFVGARATWIQDRPVLETRDGNLLISSAKNKNISLLTFGDTGSVFINDINLVQVSINAQEAATTVKTWERQLLGGLVRDVNQLTSDMTTVQQRMSFMDFRGDGTSNGTGAPPARPTGDTTFPLVGRLSARQLDTRIRRLERSLRLIRLNLRTNGCVGTPCQNGGTCIRGYDGVQCICPPNWEGATCSLDVNECENFAGTDLGCQNGATCTNLPGSYRCSCAKGWHGVHCNTKLSSCEAQDSAELCGHGVCVSTPNNEYTCICNQGWTTDGSSRECRVDVNECAGKHPACSMSPLVPCFNTDGGYHCGGCPSGYSGNGHYCHDINECLVDNGGCSTSPRVECINTIGSWSCGPCPAGYQGDGVSCTYVGACRINNGGCNRLATCVESAGYVQCNCQPGYHGTGVGPQGCIPGVSTGNPCDANPCVHGTCQPSGGGFVCLCVPGFSGTTCDTASNPCSSNPCKNGGTCRSPDSRTFICNCTSSFTGPRCENQRQSCSALYKTPSGTLEYPPRGQLYEPGLNCAFVILTNTSLVLNITFTRFDFEKSKNCRFDFLQIHDGQNAGAHLKGRFCGTDFPFGGTFTTTHNSVYFWMRTDNSDARLGFAVRWESIVPACGDYLRADHGRIASPGSPGQYPHNRDCLWIIDVRPGKRIQFHFYSVMMEEHPTCDKDYLEINETAGNREVQLGLYCNHTYPPPLLTSGSSARILFHSDGDGSDTGFQISYSAVEGFPGCGGTFTADRGVISSPGYPSNYPPNMICDWKIQLPVGEKIRITWIAFDLEKQRSCRWDAVEIFSGPDSDSPVVGRYCGNRLPESRVIDSNVALIVFTSDFSGQRTGFQLKYETICGGEFRDPSGVLRSPYYPQNYPSRRNCIYEIIQPAGKGIILRIMDMDIESHIRNVCYFDGLNIYDGDNENSTRLASLCGQQEPAEPFFSTHNYMYLKFYTDGSGNNRGFLANYSTVDRRCGGLLKEPTGIIRSHPAGEMYQANEDCTWTLKAPKGYIVQLSFTSFHLEENNGCTRDYVLVYDTSMNNQEIGRFCGSKLPSVRNSQGESMTIKFRTDYSVSHDGFIAHYVFVDATKVCGGHYFSTTGVITSPNYPSPYPANKECVWIITAPQKRIIHLQVNEFHLENLSNCGFDWLEIRNGGTERSPLIDKYCGTKIPTTIKSLTHELYLKFVSDATRHMGGFNITWDTSTHGCGGALNAMKGEIISPGYPQPYSAFVNCLWTIAVSEGSKVNLVFIDFDLENHERCIHDYVEISTGLGEHRRNGKRYCGSDNPSHLSMDSNHVTIRFRSDYRSNGRGFHIRYETLCHNKVRGFSGVIESPNFPNKYPNSANCTWIIEAPLGNKINITFSNFELENRSWNGNCSFDYVQIQEGEDDVPNTDLGTYCGTDIPARVTSTTKQVFVHFSTDKYYTHEGFRFEWVVVGCGGHLRRPVGEFQTPSYPNAYPRDIECEWLIEVDTIHSVEITFPDINTEKSMGCSYDKVQLFAGADTTAPKIAELCHSDGPVKFTSPTNKLFVKFSSDFSNAGRGFTAQYKSVDLQCGGTFHAPEGVIHSANYPNNYPHNQNCEWRISVDANHLVNLTFEELDIEATINCTDDYVKVFDGATRDDLLLGTFCRNAEPPPIISTGNTLLVVMRTDSLVSAKGFKAKFTKACGARIVTDGTGVLQTTSLLHMDRSGLNCTWTILAKDPADHVTLHFNYMDLGADFSFGGDTSSCSDHYIQVYEGDGVDGASRGQWCGDKVPPAITSNGYALTVHLYADYANVDDRFGATYSVLDSSCGGEYLSASGAFSTPNYPQNYMSNATCIWMLLTSPGNRISLTFSEFALQQSDNCDGDYVEVREESGIGELRGLFCNAMPEPIQSSKKLWIKFKSDGSGTAKGFLAEYRFLHGNELTGMNGEIASPLYPQPWKASDDVTWRITVGFGMAIRVEFDVVRIERFYDQCLSRVTVYDGYDDKAPVLSTVCGTMPPDTPIVSSSNVIFLRFSSDWVRDSNMFHLNWYQIPRETSVDNGVTQVSECEVEYDFSSVDNSSTSITTPGYPNGYGDNIDCTWVITTVPGFHINLRFHLLDLEETQNCVNDYISVYEGDGFAKTLDESQLLAKVCHSNETRDTFKASAMTIKFHSDFYINGTGARMYVWRDCGGALSGPDGLIDFNVTKRMLQYGRPQVKCEWNITVRQGKTIEVKFTSLKIDNTDPVGCKDNYILLKNGAGPESPFLGTGRFCGKRVPTEQLMTTGNKLYVKANGPFAKMNFKMTYREVGMNCGGFYRVGETQTQLDFSTPNYPNIPPPFSECFWKFMAPAGGRLALHFIERFDLSSSDNCTKEYVEVRDGGTEHSILIGRYCRDSPPGTLTTTGNMLYVHFYSEVHEPKNGFKAIVNTGICGGIVRGKTGVVRSPNYPRTYPIKQECAWWIEGPGDHTLKLQFHDLHLPGLLRCEFTDNVRVGEKLPVNDTVHSLGTFCGTRKPEVMQTDANEAIITFHSGNITRVNYRGFLLNYTASRESCGGEISGTSGEIKTSNYPNPNQHPIFCRWKITAPEGSHVILEILDVDLEESDSYLLVRSDFRSHAVIKLMTRPPYTKKLFSTSRYMDIHIYFTSGHRGLRARFTTASPVPCGGLMDDLAGSLLPPVSPYNETGFFCEWKLKAPSTMVNSQNITRTTLTVSITGSIGDFPRDKSQCGFRSKYIRMHNGDTSLGSLCGNLTDKTYVWRSPAPFNTIEVVNGSYGGKISFDVKYEWKACGGILSGPEHTIRAPENMAYPKSCVWHAKFEDPGAAIILTFKRMNFKQCDDGYILIRNGGPLSPKIGTYCGTLLPHNITSSSNELWIEYWAARDPGDFEIKLDTVGGSCGGSIRGANREILSPGFPNNYPNNAECTWEIHAELGHSIGLVFVDRFHLETSNDCTNDFVQFYDWNYDERGNGAWLQRPKFCGRETPPLFNSTTNRLKVLFRSNSAIQGDGFKAIWEENCGGVFEATGRPQFIESPNYPDDYPNKKVCNYTITGPVGKKIWLEFLDFAVEKPYKTRCRWDNVTITYNQYSEREDVLCGTQMPSVISSDNTITVIFKTDVYLTDRGFRFKFFINECGGEITEPTELSPPVMKSGQYFGGLNCTWVVKAPEGKSVVLRFAKFELERSHSCVFDRVIIAEGKSSAGPRLAKLCGNTTDPFPVRSRGNIMSVMFLSDNSNHYGGMKASVVFTTSVENGCGGTIDLQNTLPFRSQKGALYENYEDCQWSITAPAGKIIKLEMSSMDLRNKVNSTAPGCNGDYLEVRDGAGAFSDLIGRYCGNARQPAIESTMNSLWIRLYTDGDNVGAGVIATLSAVDTPCGKNVRDIGNKSEILLSPGYPGNYPHGIQCRWFFHGQSQSQLRVHFEELDMESTDGCSGDHFEISDRPGDYISQDFGEDFVYDGMVRGRRYGSYGNVPKYSYCGHMGSFDHYSTNSEVHVLLKTTNKNLPKPGKFKFVVETTACSRNYTAEQGRIIHHDITECWTTITAQPNQTISVYFNNFRMYADVNCTKTYLKVYQGDFNAPNPKTLCGMMDPNPIFSTGNKLSFHSKSSGIVYYGLESYDMSYTTTDKGRGCGGRLFNRKGVFTSPMYPMNYRNDSFCQWEISVPRTHQVLLSFTLFDLGASGICDTDYIRVEEVNVDVPREEKYCPGQNPAIFRAKTNVVNVMYASSVNNGGTGWIIHFRAVHNSDVTRPIDIHWRRMW